MKIVFSDFDGTLTKHDRELTGEFFEILELLKKNQQELVIVSGRSLSWGHFFLTHFPQLQAAIMEGGGVIVTRNPKNRHEIDETLLISQAEVQELEDISEEVKRLFPRCPLSKDSFGRLTDRAIEFEQMHDEDIQQVLQFFKSRKVNYTKSNVHINFWVGDISKYNGVKWFLENMRTDVLAKDAVFFGDAPNDQSMFQFFPNSVGVANIRHCLDRLDFRPRTILVGEENDGPKGVLAHMRKLNS